jgi:hypothetical protein
MWSWMNNDYMMNILTWFSVMLQMQNYEQELKSASNDDIAKHLAKQDTEYLEKILEKLDLLLAKVG